MNKKLIRATIAFAGATAAFAAVTGANPATAAPAPTLNATISSPTFRPGEQPVIKVTENVTGPRTFSVTDSSGAVWTRSANNSTGATFTTTANRTDGNVTITMRRTSDGARTTARVSYRIEQFPGQLPGRLILGMSCQKPCGDEESELGRPYGVHRQFEKWGNWAAVAADIDDSHAAGRLPWVSVKGPGGNAAGWRAVAAGSYDDAITALATVLKAHDDKPVLLTFQHEPSNDGTEAEGKDWAAAYSQFHDVLKAQGALVNVADPPILQDWLFNPNNKRMDPANWLLDNVLSRAPFLGIDLYQDNSGKTMGDRIPIIRSYLAEHGHPNMLIGIGETGATDRYTNTTAAQWINTSLSWAAANTDKVAVVSYFNTPLNNQPDVYWPLDESASKLATFQSFLDDPRVN